MFFKSFVNTINGFKTFKLLFLKLLHLTDFYLTPLLYLYYNTFAIVEKIRFSRFFRTANVCGCTNETILKREDRFYEENIPTQEAPAQQSARFQKENEFYRRQKRHQETQKQGQKASQRVIYAKTV